jgi:lysophospholipase L1-like esterase
VAGELGVPDPKIYLERHSRSTRENAEQAAAVLRELNARTIVLVTDRLHMRRAAGSFRQVGFEVVPAGVPIYEGHTDNVDMLAMGLREFAALGYYALRGWMSATPTGGSQAPRAASARPATVAPSEGPLLILGASYAGNWRLDSAGGVPVINAGVAGQRTFQFLERFDRDVVARRPRAVLIWGFINDYFSADDLAQAGETIQANYRAMIDKARAAGIEPILATEITTVPGDGWLDLVRGMIGRVRGRQSYQERINARVMATNAWLQEVAQQEGLLLLDFQRALADPSGRRRRQFATEDNHVPPAGYDALTRYVRPILARHFASE